MFDVLFAAVASYISRDMGRHNGVGRRTTSNDNRAGERVEPEHMHTEDMGFIFHLRQPYSWIGFGAGAGL